MRTEEERAAARKLIEKDCLFSFVTAARTHWPQAEEEIDELRRELEKTVAVRDANRAEVYRLDRILHAEGEIDELGREISELREAAKDVPALLQACADFMLTRAGLSANTGGLTVPLVRNTAEALHAALNPGPVTELKADPDPVAELEELGEAVDDEGGGPEGGGSARA